MAILFGSYLIVSGIFDLLGGATSRDVDITRRVFSIMLATLSLIAGVLVLLRPGAGIVAMVIILGVFLVISGVLELAGAVSDDLPWIAAVLGLVDVALGIVILALPDIGLITLALLFGISLVVRGAGRSPAGSGRAAWPAPSAGPPLTDRRPSAEGTEAGGWVRGPSWAAPATTTAAAVRREPAATPRDA